MYYSTEIAAVRVWRNEEVGYPVLGLPDFYISWPAYTELVVTHAELEYLMIVDGSSEQAQRRGNISLMR